MSGLRQRKAAGSSLNVLAELDAFPKVPDSYQETTASGGGVSIIVFIIIGALVFSEVLYYTETDLAFEYEVDRTFEEKLKINIDITVAMKCKWIGADVLDLTGQTAESFGRLEEENVFFELSPNQRQQFDMIQNLNDYIRDEYHAIQKLLWKTGYMGKSNSLPKRENFPERETDGCRIHGTLTVNKVAGNFHITAGKSVPVIPRGHAHLSMMVKEGDYNFSHRIDHFSYGEPTPGIICPMDTTEKTSINNFQMYQYFVQVVPTKVETTFSSLDTYQYAFTEHDRSINHNKGSHGVPGIFVKYDLSALKITVREEHKPYWQFLVRLCGIIGGIFATSGMLHTLVGFIADFFCCRLKIGKYKSGGIIGAGHEPPTPTESSPPATASLNIASASLSTDTYVQNPLLNHS